ncbi:MAG: hypothetical protein ABR554_15335 [Pyrinomonadaceae bacterium]
MKKQILRASRVIGVVAALALSCAVREARAQSPVSLRADIPFDFYLGDKKLPAGTYTLTRLLDDSNRVLVLRDSEAKKATIGTTERVEGGKAKRRPALVFHRYGDQYILKQVWAAGEREVYEFGRGGRERSLARAATERHLRGEIAANAAQPQVVEVSAGR